MNEELIRFMLHPKWEHMTPTVFGFAMIGAVMLVAIVRIFCG